MISTRTRLLVALGALYLAQGLPFGFFVQAVPVLLRAQGQSLEVVGFASLLALPWALKFLWAPFVDRWGRYEAWIVGAQAVGVAVLVLLALRADASDPTALFLGAAALNLVSATQDIATDGLAVRRLPEDLRGLGNGLQVAGYRLGMIVGGGALLVVFEALGWRGTFLALAALLALCTAALRLLPRDPKAPAPAAPEPRPFDALRHAMRAPAMRRAWVALFVFKLGEAGANGMVRPFLVDQGHSLADIGGLLGGYGFGAGLAGALLGGWAAGRWGRRRALRVFGVGQVVGVLGYLGLAAAGTGPVALAVVVEHFASGLATAALFTAMMDRCRPHAAGTDYTLQACVVVVATGAASALSGVTAARFGYVGHFALCAAIAALAPLVVPWLAPHGARRTANVNRAIYAGSFDPVTHGHLDVIDAALRLFDEVVVLVAVHPEKTGRLPHDERIAVLKAVLHDRPRVRVDVTDGLVAAYAREHGAQALVRGLRSEGEAGYELELAHANGLLDPELQTVFVPGRPERRSVSSSLLDQMASAGLDGSRLCPPEAWQALLRAKGAA